MGPMGIHDSTALPFDLYVPVSILLVSTFRLVYLTTFTTRLSAIRAKRIFLTTYYDAFEPALFAHIPKSDALQRASPSPSSISNPFSISETFSRAGWNGLLTQAWNHIIGFAKDWHTQIWEIWRRDVRTTAWPPT